MELVRTRVPQLVAACRVAVSSIGWVYWAGPLLPGVGLTESGSSLVCLLTLLCWGLARACARALPALPCCCFFFFPREFFSILARNEQVRESVPCDRRSFCHVAVFF